jgi:hypothetical protein
MTVVVLHPNNIEIIIILHSYDAINSISLYYTPYNTGAWDILPTTTYAYTRILLCMKNCNNNYLHLPAS